MEAVPAGAKAVVMFKKSDNIGGFYDVTEFGVAAVEIDSDRSIIYINYDPQVLTTAGQVAVQINFYQNDQRLSSFAFYTDVQASAVTSGEIASSWLFNILSQEIAQTLTVATTPQAMTDWLEANITQETGYVIDNTLTVAGAASDAQATGKMVTVSNLNPNTVANKVWVKKTPATLEIPTMEDHNELKSAITQLGTDLEDADILKRQPVVISMGHYTIGSNGALSENANYDTYAVEMNGVESVVVNAANIYGYFNEIEITSSFRPYAIDGTRHFDALNATLTTTAKYIVCANRTSASIVVTAVNADTSKTIGEKVDNLTENVAGINEVISQKTIYTTYDLSQATKVANEKIRFDKTTESTTVVDYYKIPVQEGEVYRVTNVVRTVHCLYAFFNSSNQITLTYPSTNQPNENVLTTATVTIPDGVAYLGVNDLSRWTAVGTSPVVETVSQHEVLSPEALPDNAVKSSLYELYLVTAGDSITVGNGIENSEGIPINNRPTYGKLAADFYGTQYNNIAMSGRTMADINVDGVTRNGFAVERYLLVPDDTDILTIWFGWNDCAHGANSMRDNYCLAEYNNLYSACTEEQKAEADTHDWEAAFVGTINSTDKTTWAGAWNFVLEYFTVTKPIEHLGVIIPFLPLGSFAASMREMLVNICKNYGVSYIDAANPNEIPTVAYCDSSRSTNYTNYLAYRTKYTADTLHPNKAGYERIARGYIPWLATI